jgi:hypothetical protein
MKVTSHTTLVVGKAGKSYPVPPGTPVDIEDEEARDLIARGLAVKVGKPDKPVEKEPKEPKGSKPPADSQDGNPPADSGSEEQP